MAKTKIGKLASKAKGLVLGFLNNPNTYLIVGTWIFLQELEGRTGSFGQIGFGQIFDFDKWNWAAESKKRALILFGGMFAICRIAKAIESCKAPADKKTQSIDWAQP